MVELKSPLLGSHPRRSWLAVPALPEESPGRWLSFRSAVSRRPSVPEPSSGSNSCAVPGKGGPPGPRPVTGASPWVDEKLVLTGRTLLPGFVDEMGGWGRSRLQPASPQGFGLGAVPSRHRPQATGATKRTWGDPSFSLCQFQVFISPASPSTLPTARPLNIAAKDSPGWPARGEVTRAGGTSPSRCTRPSKASP